MEDGLIDLDPADEKLSAELGSVKWGTDSSGRIFVETKEDMTARGLPSPEPRRRSHHVHRIARSPV
jgi:hypothetical protein